VRPRDTLIDTLAHLSPPLIVDGLSVEAAERRLQDAPHSIAEIVSHLSFWQEWFIRRCQGADVPMVASAALGWPTVAAGSWPQIKERFCAGLDTLVGLGEHGDPGAPVHPPIPFPPLANYTVRDVIEHVAHHNAHHLGQVVVLRQIMGEWPPPAGSWTW
jgi:uncharacterized damage-inducible protein DinB